MPAPKNYQVTGAMFGPHPRGTVVPGHAAERAGDPAELCRLGVLVPTDAPVTAAEPAPRPPLDVSPSVLAELDHYRTEARRLDADNKQLAAEAADLRRRADAHGKALADGAAENDRLLTALGEQRDDAAAHKAAAEKATADAERLAAEKAEVEKKLAEAEKAKPKAGR